MKEIFKKYYSEDSLYDLGRDIAEAVDSKYNPYMVGLPKDEDDFIKGTFTVTIEWSEE